MGLAPREVMSRLTACLALLLGTTAYGANPGSQYVLSPSSRTILPKWIYQTKGNVTIQSSRNYSSPVVLTGPNASVTYDFGQMVAGIPEFTFGEGHCSFCNTLGLPGYTCGTLCSGLGLSYTESARFVGPASDNSTLYSHEDGTVYLPVFPGRYPTPAKWQRGSFRYLTLSMPSSAAQTQRITVSFDRVLFTAQPSLTNPSQYAGYFHSSDDLLNRIWHAAAYTVQLTTVAANSSVQHLLILQSAGWEESAQADGLIATDEYLSDGAKRDRNPWSADLAVGIRSSVVTQKGLVAVKNALEACFTIQDVLTGYLPYAGSPLGNLFALLGQAYDSDTYHLWTIVGYAEYVLASNDTAFGQKHWSAVIGAISATYQYVDSASGLLNGTKVSDWGRVGQGGQNTALNALYYHTLLLTARIGNLLGQSNNTINDYTVRAAKIKRSLNDLLYDPSAGLFFDNTTTAGHALHPQDGNVLAVLFNLTQSHNQTITILQKLAQRHSPFGALAPELPGAISPFITGLELYARLQAQHHNATIALSLLRTQWKYMLDTFSNSTLIEGYASDGSLNYPFYPDGSGFISLAHTWSTGPLYALSGFVAGLRMSGFDVAEGGGEWAFQPAVEGAGVSWVKAGWVGVRGAYEVEWTLNGGRFEGTIRVPVGSVGTIYLPTLGQGSVRRATVDGKAVNGVSVDGFIRVGSVGGGEHTVVVQV